MVDSTYKEPCYKELLLNNKEQFSKSKFVCIYFSSVITNYNSSYKELVTAASDFQMRFEVDFVLLETWKCTG